MQVRCLSDCKNANKRDKRNNIFEMDNPEKGREINNKDSSTEDLKKTSLIKN
jgi:hypothetical protein